MQGRNERGGGAGQSNTRPVDDAALGSPACRCGTSAEEEPDRDVSPDRHEARMRSRNRASACRQLLPRGLSPERARRAVCFADRGLEVDRDDQ